MGTPTQTYVDPAIAADTGAGTLGDPYGDLQHALDTITQDATNGDQINIKAGTDEVLSAAIDLTSYGTPSQSLPLIFRGYTSAANDGGIGGISGGGSVAIINNGGGDGDGILFWDMHLHNVGSNRVVTLRNNCGIINCEVNNGLDHGFRCNAYGRAVGCHIHDVAGEGIRYQNVGSVTGCYFTNDGTSDMTYAIRMAGTNATNVIRHCIISVDGSTIGIGIDSTLDGISIANCSLLTSGTGDAIVRTGTEIYDGFEIADNLFEGWVDGVDFSTGDAGNLPIMGNSFFNCTNDLNVVDANGAFENETLASTPFDKSGSDSFANRSTYFFPRNVGDVYSASGQMGGARGAIQPPYTKGTLLIRRGSVLSKM